MYENPIITYVEKLKEKPDHVKSRIAYGVSGTITFFIFMFWISSFFQNSPSATLAQNAKNTLDDTSPVVSITGTVAGVWQGLKELKDTALQGFGKVSYQANDDIIIIDSTKDVSKDTLKVNSAKN